MRNYRKYEVWQNAMVLTNAIYDLCKLLPDNELYGLRSQMQRASVSIACNIAEGSAKSSKKDFKRFLEMSLGSAFELETLLTIAKMRQFITSITYDETTDKLDSIQRQLHGLINSLR